MIHPDWHAQQFPDLARLRAVNRDKLAHAVDGILAAGPDPFAGACFCVTNVREKWDELTEPQRQELFKLIALGWGVVIEEVFDRIASQRN